MMAETKSSGAGMKRFFLIAAGIALGMFFLYLTFRDISLPDLLDGVKEMKPIYLLPSILVMLSVQLVRALRFGLILNPFCRMGIKDLWDVMNLWAGASMIMPARLGELVRPYLIKERGASFSSGVGAVMVERFFDLSGLLLLLGVVLWKTPEVPRLYSFLGELMLAMLAAGYAVVLLTLAKRQQVERVVTRILSVLPTKASHFLDEIFRRLLDGFGVMASYRQVLLIFGYSVLLWFLYSGLTYLFLLAFSIQAPFLGAVTTQVFICFAEALPSAPGFIGTFHIGCRTALALFGIQAVTAVSFATVYHLFSLIMCLLLGLISYLTCGFRFDRKLFSSTEEQDSDNEGLLEMDATQDVSSQPASK
jgi:glycosyltransferase 2 family protein